MPSFKIDEAAEIIYAAGGKVIGRTRLQKIAYLLNATGLNSSFHFVYKHYGPFSAELASAVELGALVGLIVENQDRTEWGGVLSTYELPEKPSKTQNNTSQTKLASACVDSESIVLELAATAVFLARGGEQQPWTETIRRKPQKSTDDRLKKAKDLLAKIRNIKDLPEKLPEAVLQ